MPVPQQFTARNRRGSRGVGWASMPTDGIQLLHTRMNKRMCVMISRCRGTKPYDAFSYDGDVIAKHEHYFLKTVFLLK